MRAAPRSFARCAFVSLAFAVAGASAAAGCNSDDDDAALGVHPTGVGDASIVTTVGAGVISSSDGSLSLAGFTPPGDPGAGGILVTASGEALAISGFPFPPDDPGIDTLMVDGWNFTLEAYISVFDHVTLWDNPDTRSDAISRSTARWSPTPTARGSSTCTRGDVSPARGAAASRRRRSSRFSQKDDGMPPSTRRSTYGFGFSTVQAPGDYARHQREPRCERVGRLRAAWSRTVTAFSTSGPRPSPGPPARPPPCRARRTADGGAGYDFTQLPPTIDFRLGFSTPTNYVNCQNGTDFQNQTGLSGEDHPRGVQVLAQRERSRRR